MRLAELKEATEGMAFVKLRYGGRHIIATAPLEYDSDNTGIAPRMFCSFFIGLSNFPVINGWIFARDAIDVVKITEKEYRKMSDVLKFHGYVYNKKTKLIYRKGSKTPVRDREIKLLTW